MTDTHARGMLVCLEGIDGSGKSTQAQLLHAALPGSRLIKFPDYSTPLGKRILETLRMHEPDPMLLQCMMTANRYERQQDIESALAAGITIILDRYWPSGVAYGSADGLDIEWLISIHNALPRPDVSILLSMPAGESMTRRPDRADAYEADAGRLKRAVKGYDRLWQMMSNVPGWLSIDARDSQQCVHERIFHNVERMAGWLALDRYITNERTST